MVTEPYRKLFALGLGCGLAGVFLWPLYLTGQINYPLLTHSHLMVSGMFLAFVSGFLMTALPRMSGTPPATLLESWIAVGLIGGSALLALAGQYTGAEWMAAAQFAFLIQFAVRRFLKRQSSPPQGLFFVPVALAWGMFGLSVQGLQGLGLEISPFISSLAKIGVEQAFLLNLIVGLGSRLIPFLTRTGISDPTQQLAESKTRGLIILFFLNLSFLFEPLAPPWTVYGLRALVLIAVAVIMFSILKTPIQRTIQGAALRSSVWMTIAAYLGLAAFPSYHLALLHVLFIGGYTLLTLMIATRVVMSHGGQSLDREINSPILVATFALLVLAAFFRVLSLLPWAAAVWLLAVLIWAYGIGRFLHPSVSDGKNKF